jgi:hypothetical protein
MGNFFKKVLKKGITKDYEVESLILNENTIDEVYERYFKDPVKRKIDWCFNSEKIIYLLVNGEKMNITDENKIFEKEKIVSLFKKDKFLDINLVYRDTFSKEKDTIKKYNWLFQEKDIFISDTIRDIFDKITKDYHNKYTYLYEHNDVPVYDYDFQKFYKIQDNKVFAKGGIKYDYLELNNKENFIFFIEKYVKLKEKLKETIDFFENEEELNILKEKAKNDDKLKEKMYFDLLKEKKSTYKINDEKYTFVGYDELIQKLIDNFENKGYVTFFTIDIKKGDYLVKFYDYDSKKCYATTTTTISKNLFDKIQGKKVENNFDEERRIGRFSNSLMKFSSNR